VSTGGIFTVGTTVLSGVRKLGGVPPSLICAQAAPLKKSSDAHNKNIRSRIISPHSIGCPSGHTIVITSQAVKLR